MVRFLVLLSVLSTALAVEPYEKIEEAPMERVGEDYISQTAWRMSVQGEYVWRTVEVYESPGLEGSDWDLKRRIGTIVRQQSPVYSMVVRESLTWTKVEDRDEKGNPMIERCWLRGFGEFIAIEEMDIDGHSGGSTRFGVGVDASKAPVKSTSRSFRFNALDGAMRKKVRFTMQVIDLKRARELAKEAGVALPELEKKEWSVKLPEVVAE